MLDEDYDLAATRANAAERAYLEAVRREIGREQLCRLASDLRDQWSAVATICALGEDEARSRIESPGLRHRAQAVQGAWLDRRNWAVLGEDAAARSDFAGALATAHRGDPVVPLRPGAAQPAAIEPDRATATVTVRHVTVDA